jgi:hypothetical protein
MMNQGINLDNSFIKGIRKHESNSAYSNASPIGHKEKPPDASGGFLLVETKGIVFTP